MSAPLAGGVSVCVCVCMGELCVLYSCVLCVYLCVYLCICAVCAACGACMWLPDCFHLHWSRFAANKLLLQNTCLISVQQLSPVNAAGGALVHQSHVPERSSSEPAAPHPATAPPAAAPPACPTACHSARVHSSTYAAEQATSCSSVQPAAKQEALLQLVNESMC